MVPFLAAFALDPLLSVRDSAVLKVYLFAELAVLLLTVCFGAGFTKPEELSLGKLPTGPKARVTPVAFKATDNVGTGPQSFLGFYK